MTLSEGLNANKAIAIRTNNYFYSLMSWLQSKQKEYSLKIIKIKCESTATLYTKEKKEVIFVMQGKGGVVIDGKMHLLKLEDVLHIDSNTLRTIANVENDPMWVLSALYKD